MARTYGREPLGPEADSGYRWVEVVTDEAGLNSQVMLTTLAQNLQLVLGESPFFANAGIPSIQSVLTQVFPTLYVQRVQQQFAAEFTSLNITQNAEGTPGSGGQINPTYLVTAVLLDGTVRQSSIAT